MIPIPTDTADDIESGSPALQRRLTLPLLVLYGLGVTVGAGIYVLVGLTAAEAGIYAPISFLLAATIITFTGLTYAELSARYPVSAGEAAYVKAGLNSRSLALIIGLLVAASGVVSSATISLGATAYIGPLIPIPSVILTICLILLLGLTAAWGILESVTFAAILTVVEIAGLGFVVYHGFTLKPDLLVNARELIPPFELTAWTGITSAGLLAFFAFIGFEDLANVAEEAKNPNRNMPIAIILTISIAAVLYLIVVSVVVLSVPMDQLRASASPLSLVFSASSPTAKHTFMVVAGLATINGVLVQMIMSSRVIYGLAKQGQLPQSLATINPKTHTPLLATALIVLIILGLAVLLPIGRLAEMTSQIALAVFSFVNLALIAIKRKKSQRRAGGFGVPMWVPVVGFVTCTLLFLTGFL